MVGEARLGQVFVELADTLVHDFDVVDFLTTLARRLVDLLHADDAGVILVDETGTLTPVAASSESARLLELFEVQNSEGPCLDCYRSGQPIMNASLGTTDRWPIFGPEARAHGFVMAHALPMRLRGQAIGAVNIFASDPEPLTQDEIDIGRALADVATVGLLQERAITEARLLNTQLQAALNSRVVIEQAKGVLAERQQIDMGTAFDTLRRFARDNNRKLGDVAQGLLDGRLPAEAFSSEAR